jgi:glycosyltransferase involved in cell wall biosynthesis
MLFTTEKFKKSGRVAIIGRVPEPYGGVSVHLDRLLLRLQSESIRYDFYDLGGKNQPDRMIFPAKASIFWLVGFLLSARLRYRLIHFHASNPYILILANALIVGSRVRLAYSLHGEGVFRWATKTGPWFLRWAMRNALRRADHIFAINPSVARKLPDLGVEGKRVTWMAAYLPPTDQELDSSHISSDVHEFLNSHYPVIGMQAWFGSFIDGLDIYGLEMVVPVIKGLHKQMPKIGVCTVISGTRCSEHRQHILKIRTESDLENNWLILESALPASALFKRCNLFIRPTLTDGDSLSIRECLSAGVPVVASDAASRPEACFLYPVGNVDCMLKTIKHVLESKDAKEKNDYSDDSDEHVRRLIEYYLSFKALLV